MYVYNIKLQLILNPSLLKGEGSHLPLTKAIDCIILPSLINYPYTHFYFQSATVKKLSLLCPIPISVGPL